MSSWKTTTAGVAGIIAIVATVIKQVIDGDPSTNPEWGAIIPLLTASIAALFARDNDKSSESVGAR